MKIEEANKIIAEYMGLNFVIIAGDVIVITDATEKLGGILNYGKSLDALVPVWIKLATSIGDGVWLNFARHGVADYHMAFFKHQDVDFDYVDIGEMSPQQVACVATARAIQELPEKERVE